MPERLFLSNSKLFKILILFFTASTIYLDDACIRHSNSNIAFKRILKRLLLFSNMFSKELNTESNVSSLVSINLA